MLEKQSPREPHLTNLDWVSIQNQLTSISRQSHLEEKWPLGPTLAIPAIPREWERGEEWVDSCEPDGFPTGENTDEKLKVQGLSTVFHRY